MNEEEKHRSISKKSPAKSRMAGASGAKKGGNKGH